MSNILQELEAEIQQATAATQQENIGIIRSIGDGVAKIEGLSKVMLNEMIEFPGGVMGLAMNLEENEVGTILLGDDSHLSEGDEVKSTGRLLSVPVGRAMLGRVVNTLGEPIDGKGPIAAEALYPVEKLASGIISRQSVSVPVQTGILSVDAMIPIGRGQRELIIGDRSTGKTAIAVDTIIAQAKQNKLAEEGKLPGHAPLYSIYVAIAQKRANISRLVARLESEDALRWTIIVVASASDPAAMQYLAPYAGCAMGEYFMDQGEDALIVYDDLSKHAVAYRHIALILRRPSGREAYPGDVFYLHSRLLERSARINAAHGGGSLTALPIIETQAGDVSAYIPTNVISITDGQIFLESDLFFSGFRPAVNAGISVSRVGGAAQIKAMKQVAGRLRLDLAQYRAMAAFAQFGSDLDAATQQQLTRGSRMMELLKQAQYKPCPVAEQVAILFAAINGFVDDVALKSVAKFETDYITYLKSSNSGILEEIVEKKAISEELTNKMKASLTTFKKQFVA